MKNPSFTYIATIIVGVALFATGCMDSLKESLVEKAQEKTLETIADAQDQNLNVDIDNNVLEVTGDDGSVSQIGAGATLPADWPIDVPLPDGIELTFVTTLNDTNNVVFTSSAPPDVIISFYQAELQAEGWAEINSTEIENMSTLSANKDTRTVQITSIVNPDGQGNTTTLSIQSSN